MFLHDFFSMKNPYSICFSQVARAMHALRLVADDLLQDDHSLVDGCLAKIAETTLRENNDRSRRVLKSFVKRYHKQLESSLINLEKENIGSTFPEHLMKTATNLMMISKNPTEITASSWRMVNSIFGDLCQLEGISKRKATNRKKLYNLWISKDGQLRACFDFLLLEDKIEEEDKDFPMESCSTSDASDDEKEDEPVERKTHPVGFTNCVIPVGTVKLDQSLLEMIDHSRPCRNLCVKELIESLSKGCVVNINRVIPNKGDSPRFTGYAYCCHQTCRLYKFRISLNKNSATFDLFADKNCCHHKGKLTRSVVGFERKMEKDVLENLHPYTHRLAAANDCDVDVALRGNLQSVRKPHVFRKMRSEVLARNDMDKNDIIDIMKMMDEPEFSDYIQSVGKPFYAYLWSTKMHKVAHKVCKKGAPYNVLHFDATGSVVKSQQGKQVYVYGGGFKTGDEIYPAFDFLLSSHKTDDIVLPLISYKRSVLDTTNRWPLFPIVVMDDSMAMRSALSLAWNSMPLDRYLECAYNWMKDGSVPSDMVLMMGCNSHFSKRVCLGATKFAEKGSTLRKFFIESFIAVTQMKDFNSIMQAIRHQCIIFNSEYKTNLLKVSLQALQATVRGNEVKEEEFKPTEETDMEDEGLWEGSPLAIHLKEVESQELERLKNSSDSTKDLNPMYSPKWYNYMMKTYAPKLVFNTAIFLPDNQFSISNQLQENSHRIMKVVILKNERKKKPGRFIRLQKNRVDGLIKLHDLRIGRKPALKNKSLKSYKETFRKRLRNKTAHTSLKAVKKIDLALISAKATKKKSNTQLSSVTTRKRASSTWKFNLIDDDNVIPIKKTALSPRISNAKTVLDLLDEYGSDSFPDFWKTTHRSLVNSEVNEATLRRVVHNEWLNDEAINAFLQTRLSISPDHQKKFLLFNTFHTGYVKKGLSVSTKIYIRKVRPLEFDVWLIPVNLRKAHWTMFVVLPRQRIVLNLDSMNLWDVSEYEKVTAIVQYSLLVHGEESSLENWVTVRCTDLVQQQNGLDCGVFLCLYAEALTSGLPLDLDPNDGGVARKWLTWELCCADEPKIVAHAPLVRLGELAKNELPESKMTLKFWDKKTPSMAVIANILSRSHEENFRDEFV
jgi:Ulp1 protease family, C-terminal catalytic domain